MTLDLYERNALFCALLVTEDSNEFAYIYYLLTRNTVTKKQKNRGDTKYFQCILKNVDSKSYIEYQKKYQMKRKKSKNFQKDS